MHHPSRRAPLRLAATFALAALAFSGLARAADWPQQHSDVPTDKAVLFGQLANGMRYAIMRNTTPKGAVSMWFNIESGAVQESDAQQGLAHFLEHMAFRGSRGVPGVGGGHGVSRLAGVVA